MLRNLKINIAACMCMAFVFRLLFVYAGTIYASGSHDKTRVNLYVAHVLKTNEQCISGHSADKQLELAEFFFEDDEEDKFKLKVLPFRQFLYFIFAGESKANADGSGTFYQSFSIVSNHRYLSLQVFRI